MRELQEAKVQGWSSPPLPSPHLLVVSESKLTRAPPLLPIQCDGVRPKCNTCQSKNLTCVYDVAEDGKTTTQLRAHVRRLAKELEDIKSVISLLAMAPNRASAATWAAEIEKNGFAHHSADDIKKALSSGSARDSHEPRLASSHDSLGQASSLAEGDSYGTPGSEAFAGTAHHMGTSSYGESSRDERYF